MTSSETLNYQLLNSIQTHLYHSKILSILIHLINSIGFILLTQNITGIESSDKTFSHYLSHLLYINLFSNNHKYYVQVSLVLSIIIDLLFFSFFAFFIYSHYKKKISKISFFFFNYIVPYLLLAVNLLGSFLFEFFSLGVIHLFIDNQKHHEEDRITFFDYLEQSSFLPKVAIGVINLNASLIIFITIVFYKVFFFVEYLKSNYFSIFIETFYLFCQSIYSYSNEIHGGEHKTEILFICCIGSVVLNLAYLIITQLRTFHKREIDYLITLFITIFGLVSALFEIVIKVIVDYYDKKIEWNSSTCLFKIFSEIMISLAIIIIINQIKQKAFISSIVKNIFEEMKEKRNDYLFYFIDLIEKEKITEINDIVLSHKNKCQKKLCLCHKFSMKMYSKKKTKDVLISVGETEITAKLNYLKTNNLWNSIEELLALHIFFVWKVKKNKFFAFYLSEYYMMFSDKISFISRYSLYKIRTELITEIIKKRRDKNLNEYTKNAFLGSLVRNSLMKYKYIQITEKIKKLLLSILETLEETIKFRVVDVFSKDNNSNFNKYVRLLKTFDNKAKKIEKKMYAFHLIQNPNASTTISKFTFYPELNYILYYFYSIIKVKPIPVENISYSLFQNKKNFIIHDLDIINPIILTFNSKDDMFHISYVNFVILSKLRYQRDSLLNKPFNLLIPAFIAKEHDVYMKIYSLLGMNNTLTNYHSTFIIDKNQMLKKIMMKYSILPTISHSFVLIFNINFQKSTNHEDKISYYFIADQNSNIISYSTFFQKNFFFNLKMIQSMSINLSKLIGFNLEQYQNNFKEISNEIINSSYTLEELNNIVLSYALSNNKLRYKNYAKLPGFSKHFYTSHLKISKEAFMKSFAKIEQLAIELNLDFEYLYRIQVSKERINASIKKDLTYAITYKNISNKIYSIVQLDENDKVFDSYFILEEYRKKIDAIVNFDIDYQRAPRETKETISFVGSSFQFNKLKVGSQSSTKNVLYQDQPSKGESEFALLSFNRTKNSSLKLTLNEHSVSRMSNHSRMNMIRHTSDLHLNKTPSPQVTIQKVQTMKMPTRTNKTKLFLLSNRYLFIFMIMILGSLISLNFYNLIYNVEVLDISHKISDLHYNIVSLKGDIFDMSSFYICLCIIEDGYRDVQEDQKWKIQIRAELLITHYIKFKKLINLLHKEDIVSDVYIAFTEEDEFITITDNRETRVYKSNFAEELLKIHYNVMQIFSKEKMNHCGLNYYMGETAIVTHWSTEEYEKITTEEKGLNYFIFNTVTSLKNKIDTIAQLTNEAFTKYHKQAKKKFLLSNVIILCLIVVFYSIIIYSVFQDKATIKGLIFHFFSDKEHQTNYSIKNSIISLKQAIVEFSYHNYKQLYVVNNKTKSPKEKHNSITKKTNQKKGTETIIFDKNQHLLNNKKLLEPFFIHLALFIYLLMFAILIAFQVSNILYVEYAYNNLIYQNQIATNFLERTPKIVELTLFYFISIILDDPFFTKIEQKDYDKHIISNPYNIKFDLENNSLFKSLQNSGYAYIYYKILIDRENIEKFMKEKSKSNQLKRTIKWNTRFNMKEMFPIYASYGYNKNYNEICNVDIIKCFEDINDNVQIFMSVGNRFNKDGLNPVMDWMLQQMNSLYLDYYNNYIAENKVVDNIYYLTHSSFWVIVQNTYDIFKTTNMVYLVYLEEDISSSYKSCKSTEIIFSLFSIIINIGFFVGGILFISNKILETISLLIKVGNRIYVIITGE